MDNAQFDQIRAAMRLDDTFKNLLGRNDKERKMNGIKVFANPPNPIPNLGWCGTGYDYLEYSRLSTNVTILELAAMFGKCDILEYLLSLGIDVNHKHEGGYSALEICVTGYCHLPCLRLLLSHPNIHVPDNVLQAAAVNYGDYDSDDGKREAVTMLLEYKRCNAHLFSTFQSCWFDRVCDAIWRSPCDDKFKTLIGKDDSERKKNVLQKFDIRQHLPNRRGSRPNRITIFELIALFGRCDILEYLLGLDIDVNFELFWRARKQTVLEICVANAVINDHKLDLSCIKLLLSHPKIIINRYCEDQVAGDDAKCEILKLLLKRKDIQLFGLTIPASHNFQACNMRILLRRKEYTGRSVTGFDCDTATPQRHNSDAEFIVMYVRQLLNHSLDGINCMRDGETAQRLADRKGAYIRAALFAHGIV